jgi:uncharacterized protein YjdB
MDPLSSIRRLSIIATCLLGFGLTACAELFGPRYACEDRNCNSARDRPFRGRNRHDRTRRAGAVTMTTKLRSFWISATFASVAMAGIAACDSTSPKPSISQVLIAPGTATISTGQSVRIVATVSTNPIGSVYALTWTTSNPAAATVDSTGLALGISASPAVSICATATTGSVSSEVGTCATLTVTPAPSCPGPTGILTPAADTMHVGDVFQFQIPAAQLTGRSPNEIRWTSDFAAAARVDSLTGVVTAVSAGGTDVIATDVLLTSPCPHEWRAMVVVH